MKRLLCVVLLSVACRENPSPESQATVTTSETTVSEAPVTVTETAPVQATVPVNDIAPLVKGPKLVPVDEASGDPSLVAFRDELLAAVRRGDVDALVALADPKIRTSFGDGGGAAELRRGLKEGSLMKELEQILPLGGKFVGTGETRSFWAPYVYSAFPDSHDVFQSLVVIGEKVPLRQTPKGDAHVMALLSHDIVEIGKKEGDWQQIKTADGRHGWVEKRSVRSPIGYRAGFLKMDGKWRMNALVAGD